MFKATYNITRHYVCTISRKLKQTWKMSETKLHQCLIAYNERIL
jgi:hypothetical protein